MNNPNNDPDVKNIYYVNGNQNNYNINMSGNAMVKIYGNGNDAVEFEDNVCQSDNVDDNDSHFGTPSEVFFSPEAESIFAKLRKANILDNNNMPKNLSWAKRGLLASEIAQRLGIDNVWLEVGNLWKMKKESLRGGFNNGIKQPNMDVFMKELKQLLN